MTKGAIFMVYVTSDWHGYSTKKIKALLSRVGFSKDDFLFILGDVIDRGEDGIKLLKEIMYEPNIELILGNHEVMMLSCAFLFEELTESSLDSLSAREMSAYRNWKRNGAEPTIRALRKETPELRAEILDYLSDAPLYDTVTVGGKDFVLVHGGLGGFSEDKKLDEYTDYDLIWTRPTLYTKYSSNFTTVLGHTPTYAYGDEFVGKVIITDTFIDIDTGAASGLSPCLLRLDDMRTFFAE